MRADTTSLAIIEVCLHAYGPFEHVSALSSNSFVALGDGNSHIGTVAHTNHTMDAFGSVPDRTENTPTTGLVTK
jgi:hypothetical protein